MEEILHTLMVSPIVERVSEFSPCQVLQDFYPQHLLDVFSVNAFFDQCQFHIVPRVRLVRLQALQETYSLSLAACRAVGCWEVTLEILDALRSRGLALSSGRLGEAAGLPSWGLDLGVTLDVAN